MKRIIIVLMVMLFSLWSFCGCAVNDKTGSADEKNTKATVVDPTDANGTAVAGAPDAEKIADIIGGYVDLDLYDLTDSSEGYTRYTAKEQILYSFGHDFEIDGKPLSMLSKYSDIVDMGFSLYYSNPEPLEAGSTGGFLFTNEAYQAVLFTICNNTEEKADIEECGIIDGVRVDSPTWPEFSICGVTNSTDIKDALKTLGVPNSVMFYYYEELARIEVSFCFEGADGFLTLSVDADGNLCKVSLL